MDIAHRGTLHEWLVYNGLNTLADTFDCLTNAQLKDLNQLVIWCCEDWEDWIEEDS